MTKDELAEQVCKAISAGIRANKTYEFHEPVDCFCRDSRLSAGWSFNFSALVLGAIEEACRVVEFPASGLDNSEAEED